MKKLFHFFLFLFIGCLVFIDVYAQDKYVVFDSLTQHRIYIGVQAGISIPNLTAGSNNQNPLSNGYSSRLGADFGVLAMYHVKGKFSLQAGIDYSQQGGKHNGLQAISDPNPAGPPYLYANFNNSAHLNYLMIPIMARFDFYLSHKLKLYAEVGGFAGFLLSAKTVTSGSSLLYADSLGQEPLPEPAQSFDTTTDIKSSINTFNAGIIGAIGLTYEVCGGKIFIEGGGNYGFINIQKFASDGTNYSGAAIIHVGYLYALKCKKMH